MFCHAKDDAEMTNGAFIPGVDPGLKKWLVMRQKNRDLRNSGSSAILLPNGNQFKFKKYWNDDLVAQVSSTTVIKTPQYAQQQCEAILCAADMIGAYVISRLAIDIRNNHLLEMLLNKKSFGVNAAVNEFGQTLLHLACHRGNLGKVKIILDSGGDPNVRDGQNATPLHLSIRECSSFHSIDIIRHLLDAGANCSLKDDRGHTALHKACIVGQRDIVQVVLSLPGGQRCISVPDARALLPLDHAAKFASFYLDLCRRCCNRQQNRQMWARVMARDFVASVFSLVQPVCAVCKRKLSACGSLKRSDYRYWMYVHGRLSKEPLAAAPRK